MKTSKHIFFTSLQDFHSLLFSLYVAVGPHRDLLFFFNIRWNGSWWSGKISDIMEGCVVETKGLFPVGYWCI